MQNEKENFKREFKKRLYDFTLRLIDFIDELPGDNVSKRIGDQLLRSGTSIVSNYIEGQASSSRREFINYFQISLKSANESKLWVALLRDKKRAKRDQAEWFLGELDEITKIFASSVLTLKGKKKL
jgi:four helix bundle protein